MWWVACLFSSAWAACEYSVVGSGWSGLYFAWRLTQPPLLVPPSSLCVFEAHSKRIGGRAYGYHVEDLAGWDNRTVVDLGAYRFQYSAHELVRSVVVDLLNLPTQCYSPDVCVNATDEYHRIAIPDGPGRGNPAGYDQAVQGLRDLLVVGGMPPIFMGHRLVSVYDASQSLPPTPSCADPSNFTNTTLTPSATANSIVTLRFRVSQPVGCTWEHVNTSVALLNVPFSSLQTLTQDSIVFTKARSEVLQAYKKPSHTPISKLYLVYDNAWWKTLLNLTTGTFELHPTEDDETSLFGRFYDGPVFNCTSTDCPGALFISYKELSSPSDLAFFQELRALRNSTFDPATRLTRGLNPLADSLLDKIQNSLLDYFESVLLQAGLPPTLPEPSSLVFSLWWATDFETALFPSWEADAVSCDDSKLFLRPTTQFDVFLAGEAYSCRDSGWADTALQVADKVLAWRYNYSKPEGVSETYWQTSILGGPSRLAASLLPRIPQCFVTADCANGAMCIDYFCSPPCTNVTDCAVLLAPCREVSCGVAGFCHIDFLNSSCASPQSCTNDVCKYGYCEVGPPKCAIPAHPACFASECTQGNCSIEIKVNASCADPTHPCGGKCDAQGQCQKVGGAPLGANCKLGNECCSGFCLSSICSNVPPSDCEYSATNYRLGWRFHDTNLVTFVFATNSTGWVAMGLGDSMTNADIMAGWIDPISGEGFVDDYWATGTRTPRADTLQGGTYDLLNAKVEALPSGALTVTVTRKLDTGDLRDRVVSVDQNQFIYAFKNGKAGDFKIHDVHELLTIRMNCRAMPYASHVRPDRKPSQMTAGQLAVVRLTAFDKSYNRLRTGGFEQLFHVESDMGRVKSTVEDLQTGRYLLSVNLTKSDPLYNFSILFNDTEIESSLVQLEILPAPFETAVLEGLLVPVASEPYPFWLVATDVFLNPCNGTQALENRAVINVVAYVVAEKGIREELPTDCSMTLLPFGKGLLGFTCNFNSPHGAEVQHFIDVRVRGVLTTSSPYLVPHTPHEWATWVIWLLVISIAIILVLCVFIFRIWRREKLEKQHEKEHKDKLTSSVSQRSGYGTLIEV